MALVWTRSRDGLHKGRPVYEYSACADDREFFIVWATDAGFGYAALWYPLGTHAQELQDGVREDQHGETRCGRKPMNFRWRRIGWRAHKAATGLLKKYPDRRHDHAHDPKTHDDRVLDLIKVAFIAGCKNPDAPVNYTGDFLEAFRAGQRCGREHK